jgi:hypothetical protein
MNKYRALIWEQTRVAGVLAVWCFFIGTMILLACRFAFGIQLHPTTAEFGRIPFLVITLGIAGCFVLRQDGGGHMVTTFEKRLARLPVRTLPLTSIVFFTRLAYLALACVALRWVNVWLFGAQDSFGLFYSVVPVSVYLLAQTIAWTHRSLTVWPYLAVILLVIAPVAASLMTGQGYLELLGAAIEALATPGALPLLLVGAYGLSLLGVHIDRRDERYGPPTLREWSERLSARETDETGFPSPLQAQMWYEHARAGRLLPMLTLAFTLAFSLIALGMPGLKMIASIAAQAIPLAAFVIAALITGMIAFRPRSQYMYLRPVETRLLAQAKIRVLGRSLLATLPIPAALSIAGFLIFGGAERELLWGSITHGEAAVSEVLAVFLGPVLAASCVAWIALLPLVRSSILPALAMVFVPMTVALVVDLTVGLGSVDDIGLTLWSISAVTIVACLLSFASARRAGHLRTSGVVSALFGAVAVAGLLILIGPSDIPVALPVILLPGVLLVSALAGTPLTIQDKRVH